MAAKIRLRAFWIVAFVVVAAAAVFFWSTTGAREVATGRPAAVAPVGVRARVDGQIEKASFRQGEIVRQGDLLVSLDARPLEAALDQAEAKRRQDQATLDNSRRDLQRYSQLAAKSYATEQQLDTQRALVASGTAQIAADDAAIENARTQLSYTEIRAPIGGRIGFRPRGRYVRGGGIAQPERKRPWRIVHRRKRSLRSGKGA